MPVAGAQPSTPDLPHPPRCVLSKCDVCPVLCPWHCPSAPPVVIPLVSHCGGLASPLAPQLLPLQPCSFARCVRETASILDVQAVSNFSPPSGLQQQTFHALSSFSVFEQLGLDLEVPVGQKMCVCWGQRLGGMIRHQGYQGLRE